MNKSEIRKKIIKLRKRNFSNNLFIKSTKIFELLKKLKIKNKIVGAYYPYLHEIDTIEILKKLEKRKIKISLPKIEKNKNMNFYQWSFKDPLFINNLGIPEPKSNNLVYPNILLVPVVAFDHQLNRLGYGGGFYDRYLSKHKRKKKIISIGMAYSFQKIKELPINHYDIKLDTVITDKKIFQ